MRRYILRRLIIAVLIVFGVSVVTFTFANLAPGDPVQAMVRPGSDVRPADLEQLKAALGLDKPWHERYIAWVGQILQGTLLVAAVISYEVVRRRTQAATIREAARRTAVPVAAVVA